MGPTGGITGPTMGPFGGLKGPSGGLIGPTMGPLGGFMGPIGPMGVVGFTTGGLNGPIGLMGLTGVVGLMWPPRTGLATLVGVKLPEKFPLSGVCRILELPPPPNRLTPPERPPRCSAKASDEARPQAVTTNTATEFSQNRVIAKVL
jgi:hypothetical protein